MPSPRVSNDAGGDAGGAFPAFSESPSRAPESRHARSLSSRSQSPSRTNLHAYTLGVSVDAVHAVREEWMLREASAAAAAAAAEEAAASRPYRRVPSPSRPAGLAAPGQPTRITGGPVVGVGEESGGSPPPDDGATSPAAPAHLPPAARTPPRDTPLRARCSASTAGSFSSSAAAAGAAGEPPEQMPNGRGAAPIDDVPLATPPPLPAAAARGADGGAGAAACGPPSQPAVAAEPAPSPSPSGGAAAPPPPGPSPPPSKRGPFAAAALGIIAFLLAAVPRAPGAALARPRHGKAAAAAAASADTASAAPTPASRPPAAGGGDVSGGVPGWADPRVFVVKRDALLGLL